MKKIFFALLGFVGSTIAFAQVDSTTQTTSGEDTTTQASMSKDNSSNQVASADTAGISEEDLRKYAVVMDSINAMKQDLLSEITDMVKGNENITNSRYNELSKANADEAKLKEMKATPEEITFVKAVNDKKNEGAAKIGETFQTLARDYIGVETYNEVKNALSSDAELKARYDEILTEVQNEDSASSK